MSDCGKCLHVDVCKTEDSCDGKVPNCKHFLQNGTLLPVTCKLEDKGCFGEGKCWYKKDCENKVVTHADKLRAMSDEELAKFLAEKFSNMQVGTMEGCGEPLLATKISEVTHMWFAAWMQWLNQPVEESRK